MKYLLASFLTLVFVSTANASWNYVLYQDGWYVRTNGFTNDGWYYRAVPYSTCDCYGCYTTAYTYYPAVQIASVAEQYNIPYGNNSAYVSHINYSHTWKEDLVNALSANKDTELFIQAVRESGLHPSGVAGAPGSGYGGFGPIFAPGYQTTGYSVLSQGFAQNGSSVVGNAGYSSGLYQVDVNTLLDKQARLVERTGELGAVAQNNYAANIHEVESAQANAQQMQIAGQLYVETIKAAQTPKTQSTSWTTTPIQPQVQQPQAQQGNQSGYQQQVPPQPQQVPTIGANPNGPALSAVQVDVIIAKKCAECHGPKVHKKDLDLTAWKSWDPNRRAGLYDILKDKLTRNDDQRMPPPGHEDVTNEERSMLLSVFSPQQ